MRLSFFSIVFICYSFLFYGQNPGICFGGSENDIAYSLCESVEGGYLLTGSTRSFRGESEDMYIISIDENGIQNWSKVYGNIRPDILRHGIALGDGYLFTGTAWVDGAIRDDIYLLKVNLQGEKIFEHTYGTNARDAGHKVIQTSDGGFIILGYSRSVEPHGDFLLIRTDDEGNEIWRNNYGTDLDDVAFGLCEDSVGNILIFGSIGNFYYDVHYNFHNHDADMILIKIDASGNELWRHTYGEDGHDLGYDLLPAGDGGFYLFGSSQSFGAESFDMLLIKVDEFGDVEWQQRYGGQEYEYGISIDQNMSGELFLFGTTKSFGNNGSADYYLIKTNEEGDMLWETTLGGTEIEYGNAVLATADRGCAVIGSTKSFGSGGDDFLFVKLNKNGVVENIVSSSFIEHPPANLIYPNPAQARGRAMLPKGTTSYKMEIFNSNGELVKTCLLAKPSFEFNIEFLPQGLYLCKISTPENKQLLTSKLLVN